MLQRNKKVKLTYSAKIVCRGKVKIHFRRDELDKFEAEIERLEDEIKQGDAKMVLDYIVRGSRVVLMETGEIYLFPLIGTTREIQPAWIISDNQELYALLENLV